jgi:hypothetical protein
LKHGSILCFGLVFTFCVGVCLNPVPSAAQASPKQTSGILSGVVRDSSGTPQLGANVEVLSELPGVLAARHFLTNTDGVFRGENLAPGVYTVRVTLAGFLPVLERHVKIASNLTTVVRIELESMFASIEQLRRPPVNGAAEAEDWKWVLRSSSGLRPILQWHEEETDTTSAVVLDTVSARPLARIEVTGGARRPGSISNVTGAPGTEFAYDQRIDNSNHIVFAGQVSYDGDAPAGGLAAVWLPTGSLEKGPQSTLALREARIGPDGPIFRGVRLDQSGSLTFGDRYLLRVGGEYDLVGLRSSAWSLKPRLSWETKVSPNWYVDLVYASLPPGASTNNNPVAELTGTESTNVLSSAMNQLDAFPALLWRAGKPVLENGMHEELAVERRLGPHSLVQVAGFHDDNSHVALFVKGYDLPAAEYFQDFYSKGFAYDGGSSVSWGARCAAGKGHRRSGADNHLCVVGSSRSEWHYWRSLARNVAHFHASFRCRENNGASSESRHALHNRLQVGQWTGGLAGGLLWRRHLRRQPLPLCRHSATAPAICPRALGGQCGMRQSPRPGICAHEHSRRPDSACTRLPEFPGRVKSAVLGRKAVLKSCIPPTRKWNFFVTVLCPTYRCMIYR